MIGSERKRGPDDTPRPPGKVREISSTGNPLVKDIRALAMRKYRDKSGRFVAEGLKLVTDALAGGWSVDTMLFARHAAADARIAAAAAQARAQGADILEVSDKVLAAISRRDNPQTVIGVVQQKWADPAAAGGPDPGFWIALDRVRDPGNLGTIIRTADAVGARGVMLVGDCTDPFGLEAVRATMGSLFHVALVRMSAEAFRTWRGSWHGKVVGTHLEGAVDYREPDYAAGPTLLLMGNEQQGLPANLASCCDVLCRIPMAGAADSLNLAVATGIMAYELRRHALPGDAARKEEG